MTKIEPTQISSHGRSRDDMRRDAKNLMNRLKSIKADAAFVSEISDLLPQFPVFANERCGTWYVHPSKIQKPGVYFKSTDGHTGRWDFNLRRYNPHLITAIIENGGCIIVDSTRKGKRVPDALSKTIPIWCATINTAIRKSALQDHERQQQSSSQSGRKDSSPLGADAAEPTSLPSLKGDKSSKGTEAHLPVPSLDSERWDTRYHSLPSLISRSEHAQIAEKIDAFAEKLMRFTDITPLTTRLSKPIRPIWLTPQSVLFKDDMPDYSRVNFLPVICLSASRVVPEGMEECDGYLYVQGSGDDEEMWSEGLTPDLFWKNEDYLLEEGITSAECERRAREIVREAKKVQLECSHQQLDITVNRQEDGTSKEKISNGQLLFTPSMELCSEIKPSPFWIGNNASGRIPDCWQSGFDMVINCAAEIQRDSFFEWTEGSQVVLQLGGTGVGGTPASLCIVQRHQWETATSASSSSDLTITTDTTSNKEYYYLHLPIAEGKKGQHQLLEMIPIAIKAVESFYASRTMREGAETMNPRILIHCQQGMDRSVGITLAILVSCFEEGTGRYCGANTNQRTATKETIQRRLFQIMSHRLAARPSRATLKMINTYFMSPTDPLPAKYKR
ncbi:hypothetical protein BGZ80_010516 [Entomortierella chlamydospora]|uniref:tRNA A64-2'-O-ribosylphosphate transferase n=1 Tax=Entomortierella chlamydospora TaxID=101097 RepID=A0A9P6T4G7_9FUNG|nr:hypothetical protein BGZ80_010516 [Entomortierella chlamydospora]